MAGGTPGPQDYLIELLSAFRMLQEMASYPTEAAGQRGIGVLTSDTLGWQRGGPDGPSMNELLGLVFPLLERGVGVQLLPVERLSEPEYLDGFRVLMLSYDMWKPLSNTHHAVLNEWVRSGGALLFLGGSDPYNSVDEWWKQDGYAAPQDHLFELLGAIPQGGKGAAYSEPAEPALVETNQVRNLSNQGRKTIRLNDIVNADTDAIYVQFGDSRPQDGWGVYLTRVQLMDGTRVLTDIRPNTPGEAAVLVKDEGSQVPEGSQARFADGINTFTYRLEIPEGVADPRLRAEVGNEYEIFVWTNIDGPVMSLAFQDIAPWKEVFSGMTIPLRSTTTSYSPADASIFATLGVEGEDRAVMFEAERGLGRLIYLGIEPNLFAEESWGSEVLFPLVNAVWMKTAGAALETRNLHEIQRGPYRIVRTMSSPTVLEGRYVDILDSRLPVLENPRISPGEAMVYKEVRAPESTRDCRLLFSNAKVTGLTEEDSRISLTAAMPQDVRAVFRFSAPAGPPESIVTRIGGEPNEDFSQEFDETTGTLLLECDGAYGGLELEITWSAGVHRRE